MAWVGQNEEVAKESRRVEEKILQACVDENSTVVANAALWVAIAICYKGGATKEQVEQVCKGVIDCFAFARSN